jgi:hypothetical protein
MGRNAGITDYFRIHNQRCPHSSNFLRNCLRIASCMGSEQAPAIKNATFLVAFFFGANPFWHWCEQIEAIQEGLDWIFTTPSAPNWRRRANRRIKSAYLWGTRRRFADGFT